MKLTTDYFNISGKLYSDLGYNDATFNQKFNIDLIRLEKELELNKYKIFNSNNLNGFNRIKQICKKYNIVLCKRTQRLPNVDLKVWIDGEFDPGSNSRSGVKIKLYVNLNDGNALNSRTWNYFKKQLLSKFIHEVIHFLRYSENKQKWFDDDFHEYSIEKYLSSVEEQYSYSHEILFELITNSNRSCILSWYNKKVKDEKVLKHFAKLINDMSKKPIFQNKIKVELV